MSPEIARWAYALTPRELRLLKLLVDGHSYKTAVVQLRVSCAKQQVHSKSEAVARALNEDLLD